MKFKRLDNYIIHSWYEKKPIFILRPLAWIFRAIVWLRRWAYHIGLFKIHYFPIPVIVVGNLTVGGTGKTPCVIALVEYLQSKGFKPGIISRGYGGKLNNQPYTVQTDSLAADVGDEALVLKARCDCPVIIAKKRTAAAKKLIEMTDCNIILSDDGLQHYALGRDIEIVMIDGSQGFGNGYCLPAGPLREPLSRLNQSDFLIITDNQQYPLSFSSSSKPSIFNMKIQPALCYRLQDPTHQKPLQAFIGQTLHAAAAIGSPKRFFNILQENHLSFIPHPFPDHHLFQEQDFSPFNKETILLTEKDAVKCRSFQLPEAWVLPIGTHIEDAFFETLFCRILNI